MINEPNNVNAKWRSIKIINAVRQLAASDHVKTVVYA